MTDFIVRLEVDGQIVRNDLEDYLSDLGELVKREIESASSGITVTCIQCTIPDLSDLPKGEL